MALDFEGEPICKIDVVTTDGPGYSGSSTITEFGGGTDKVNRKNIVLGRFKNINDAADARMVATQKRFGEFTREEGLYT